MPATTKPAARAVPERVSPCEARSGIWSNAAPAITGIAMRNENAAASSAATPSHSAIATVVPEREMPGTRGERLREADQEGHAPPWFLPFLPPERPACAPQDHSCHQKGGGRHERALEEPLDRVPEEHADDRRRERREGEQPYIPPSVSISPKRAVQQLDETAAIDQKHGNQRGHMYGNFELHALNFQPEQRLADHQVSGTRHREEFGRPLQSPEEHRLPNAHSREAALRLCVSMTLRQKSS